MDLGFSAADLAVREEVRSFLATERPLYGDESPEPIGSKHAAMPTYFNSRAWTIFGGSNDVQKTIISKTVVGSLAPRA